MKLYNIHSNIPFSISFYFRRCRCFLIAVTYKRDIITGKEKKIDRERIE